MEDDELDEDELSIPYTGGGLAELKTIPENKWKWAISAYAQNASEALSDEENLILASPGVQIVFWATELYSELFQNGLIGFFARHFENTPLAIHAMHAIDREDYGDILHKLYIEGFRAAARLVEEDYDGWSGEALDQDEAFMDLVNSIGEDIDEEKLEEALNQFILQNADELT